MKKYLLSLAVLVLFATAGMMMLVSASWVSPSTSSGNFRSGQRRSHSAQLSVWSGSSRRNANGVAFS